jgi:oxygen-independent coproporphyrinogen III oxidase
MQSLIQKYNVPGPRYTSYPTVPYWDGEYDSQKWINSLRKSLEETSHGVSIYIHLPFCESMCTFCGCNKRITKNHQVEKPYIEAVLKEWWLYCNALDEKPVIKELHLGGGTPTFFSPQNLEYLINGIFSYARKAPDCEIGFEGHPNNTTAKHLQQLYNLGFRRVSYGVQDYSEKVQQAIHRIQPFQNVAEVTIHAREMGYTSIGHDLIFGLPFQTVADVKDTIEKTVSLLPDRIAFYSYAHVPWIKGNGQRGFDDTDIPKDDEKRKLYEVGKNVLKQNGYREIGMDHFALETDSLFVAAQTGKLHRNFMGYTPSATKTIIGLGVSAISDSWYGFAQNTKNLEDYYQLLDWNQLPIVKGHALTAEDLGLRQHILNLSCRFETILYREEFDHTQKSSIVAELEELEKDGLVTIDSNKITITEAGKPFIRNVCMAFDLRMKRNQPTRQIFSLTV